MQGTAPESCTSYSYKDLALATFQGACSYRRLDWSFGEMPIITWPREWMSEVRIGRTSSKMRLGLLVDAL